MSAAQSGAARLRPALLRVRRGLARARIGAIVGADERKGRRVLSIGCIAIWAFRSRRVASEGPSCGSEAYVAADAWSLTGVRWVEG